MSACLHRLVTHSAKPVLVYVVPFDIWKLRTGGGQRIAGIAKVLSRDYNVLVLTSAWSTKTFTCQELCPDCHLIAVPAEAEFIQRLQGGAIAYFAFTDYFDRLIGFNVTMDILASHVRACIFESPIAWPVVQRFQQKRWCVCYDAPNDYAQFLQKSYSCKEENLVSRLLTMERHVVGHVSVASFCTERDLGRVRDRNPAVTAHMVVVPNGVDVAACQAVWPSQARQRRRAVGFARPLAVFVGAHHNPNFEAVDLIAKELAPAFPEVVFVVVGLNLNALRNTGRTLAGENLVVTGPVSEDCKTALYALAEIALAPMKSGTGSSLKVPDYVAHGKIVVATPIGLRGFEDLAKFPSVISAQDVRAALAEVLERLEMDPAAYDPACRQAREWTERSLDWSVAAQPLVAAMGDGEARP
ncbi:MAG TPA: glycosyltransferase [Kiritimatiellia bacterium]|nr:glycosyltransferase [Kiritimatiellia bacterium]